jgi:hypothetical protein
MESTRGIKTALEAADKFGWNDRIKKQHRRRPRGPRCGNGSAQRLGRKTPLQRPLLSEHPGTAAAARAALNLVQSGSAPITP